MNLTRFAPLINVLKPAAYSILAVWAAYKLKELIEEDSETAMNLSAGIAAARSELNSILEAKKAAMEPPTTKESDEPAEPIVDVP
jgi:hypothetical protein